MSLNNGDMTNGGIDSSSFLPRIDDYVHVNPALERGALVPINSFPCRLGEVSSSCPVKSKAAGASGFIGTPA